MTCESPEHRAEPAEKVRRGFHKGDPDAVDAIAVQFHDELFRYCMALLGHEDHAAEAVQEVFLRLLERHRLYDPARPFRPWLFTIARNLCLEELRRHAARFGRVVDMEPTDDEVARLSATAPTALEALLRDEAEGAALAALQELPEAVRVIVAMHLFEGLAFRQIGEALGRPLNTVATAYYRALADLRERLNAEQSDRTRRSRHAS